MSSMAWDAWQAGITTSFGGEGKASLYRERSFHSSNPKHQNKNTSFTDDEKYFSQFEDAKIHCINKGTGVITRKGDGFVWRKCNDVKRN